MLDNDALLSRSHSRGLEASAKSFKKNRLEEIAPDPNSHFILSTLALAQRFQQMSQDSFSKVNSGVSQLGASDPDTA